jgi:hypothetical protein
MNFHSSIYSMHRIRTLFSLSCLILIGSSTPRSLTRVESREDEYRLPSLTRPRPLPFRYNSISTVPPAALLLPSIVNEMREVPRFSSLISPHSDPTKHSALPVRKVKKLKNKAFLMRGQGRRASDPNPVPAEPTGHTVLLPALNPPREKRSAKRRIKKRSEPTALEILEIKLSLLEEIWQTHKDMADLHKAESRKR